MTTPERRPRPPYTDLTQLYLDTGAPLALDTPAWESWLSGALRFTVLHPTGNFAIAREKQARGTAYWIARRMDQGRCDPPRQASYSGGLTAGWHGSGGTRRRA